MKIMHRKEPWDGKVNFIDENGAYVGFDYEGSCCEDFGWFLSDKKGDWVEDFKMESEELPGWTFDPSYCNESGSAVDHEGGGQAEFRLVNGDKEKFLTIYNHHNGYYGHGFEFVVPKDTSKNREGCI